jgi:putative transposase
VKRAEDYPWSSYRCHGAGDADDLVDPLINYDELSPYSRIRQRKWSEKVHRPLEESLLTRIRRSTTTGLPYGEERWVKRLAKRLDLDLSIRPRGRPKKQATAKK